MNTLAVAKGITLVDVHYLGVDQYIAPCLIEDPSGVAVVDPGPTSSLAGLEAGLAERGLTTADIHTLLLTHIHLDHAGAAGTLVKRHPQMRVYVHEKGARHMIDPAKLLASAVRQGLGPQQIAEKYNVSLEMARFRYNSTGVRNQVPQTAAR